MLYSKRKSDCEIRPNPYELSKEVAIISYDLGETNRAVHLPTYLFPPRDSSLRSEPLGAKIYAKKAAFADFVRFGGEPLAWLADADGGICLTCT